MLVAARRLAALSLVALLLAFALPAARAADEPIEIFDAHLHYNWEPKPFLPLEDVLALFRKHRVTGILATSRPNAGTHALIDAAKAGKAPGLWIVPFIRPYRVRADVGTWFRDPGIYDLVIDERKRGYYRGIGEFHITGKDAENAWVKKVVALSVADNLYLHAHADDEAVEILFRHDPRARIIWAHTGFSLPAKRVAELLDKYPALWGELSYRSGIVDGAGKLTAEWRDLLTRRSDRFLVGSDTWIDQRWTSYGEIIAGYRHWLAQLPRDAATNIAHANARRLFGGGKVGER